MLIEDNVYILQDGWMRRNARPLDLARWMLLTNRADEHAVLEALSAFQNPDGGFGHALEPDCWNPNSAPLQTWAVTTILRELNLFDPTIPLIKRLADYLCASISGGVWQTVMPSNNDYPRAPWWTYDPESAIWGYNPTAALLGYLARIGILLEAEIHQALESFFNRTITDMHELRLFIDLCEDLAHIDWSLSELALMRSKLLQDCQTIIEPDSDKWTGYVCRPSQVIKLALPPYLEALRGLVEQEKVYLRESVNTDGTWDVSWEWGQFPEEFAVAKNWWKASLIIQYHHFLAI